MRNKKPSITIGISAYNEEANIKSLLSSLLSQNQKSLYIQEIIVISDGSTDSTVLKAQEVKDRRIRIIEREDRKGQAERQNEIIEGMSKESNYLLLLEADTMPSDKNYIDHLIKTVPSDGKFGFIVGNAIPLKATNLFERLMNVGFFFRKELFEKATNFPNLYLCTGQSGKLFSRLFLKNFRWDKEFQPDSYCFRKAKRMKLEILRSVDAKIYFKSVSNLRDYLIQTGKFQKAKDKERAISSAYGLNLDNVKVCQILMRYLIKYRLLFLGYVTLAIGARVYSLFLPEYSSDWAIYKSSKSLGYVG